MVMRAVSFVKEVKQELLKVKWPTFREVAVIAAFVILSAGLTGLLFLFIDSVIYKVIKLLLGIGGGR